MATAAFLRPEEEKLFQGQPKVDLSMMMSIRKLEVLDIRMSSVSPIAQTLLPDHI